MNTRLEVPTVVLETPTGPEEVVLGVNCWSSPNKQHMGEAQARLDKLLAEDNEIYDFSDDADMRNDPAFPIALAYSEELGAAITNYDKVPDFEGTQAVLRSVVFPAMRAAGADFDPKTFPELFEQGATAYAILESEGNSSEMEATFRSVIERLGERFNASDLPTITEQVIAGLDFCEKQAEKNGLPYSMDGILYEGAFKTVLATLGDRFEINDIPSILKGLYRTFKKADQLKPLAEDVHIAEVMLYRLGMNTVVEAKGEALTATNVHQTQSAFVNATGQLCLSLGSSDIETLEGVLGPVIKALNQSGNFESKSQNIQRVAKKIVEAAAKITKDHERSTVLEKAYVPIVKALGEKKEFSEADIVIVAEQLNAFLEKVRKSDCKPVECLTEVVTAAIQELSQQDQAIDIAEVGQAVINIMDDVKAASHPKPVMRSKSGIGAVADLYDAEFSAKRSDFARVTDVDSLMANVIGPATTALGANFKISAIRYIALVVTDAIKYRADFEESKAPMSRDIFDERLGPVIQELSTGSTVDEIVELVDDLIPNTRGS